MIEEQAQSIKQGAAATRRRSRLDALALEATYRSLHQPNGKKNHPSPALKNSLSLRSRGTNSHSE